MQTHFHKKKIINDPVYGFVTIPAGLLFELIEHPVFQRLRRIKQLGLTNMVYPGALHTRFQHVIGAMGLTIQAVETLRSKGIEITDDEAEGVYAAVLLHDIGHGPYSHTLEHVLIPNLGHEEISLAFMHYLNRRFNGRLDLAIRIFTGDYPKKFLHQMVSGQLDMDRLDYLRRDSFYTGVQEGVIGHDRIINMLSVVNGELVIEEKGIYSIEKFLIARRLMYWQVYLHKTVVAAETLLIRILERASWLASKGEDMFATPAFRYFLYQSVDPKQFLESDEMLERFSKLDDDDVFASIKVWAEHEDQVLSMLCNQLRNRQLPKTELSNEPFPQNRIASLIQDVADKLYISGQEAGYFVFTDSVMNKAYTPDVFTIQVACRDGRVLDIARASDQYNISALTKPVTKYFLCYPKK